MNLNGTGWAVFNRPVSRLSADDRGVSHQFNDACINKSSTRAEGQMKDSSRRSGEVDIGRVPMGYSHDVPQERSERQLRHKLTFKHE